MGSRLVCAQFWDQVMSPSLKASIKMLFLPARNVLDIVPDGRSLLAMLTNRWVVIILQLDREILIMPFEPLDRLFKPSLERRRSYEPKPLPSLGNIQAAAWLAVRPGRVPLDLTAELDNTLDDLCKITNLDLLSAAQVDRFRRVVSLRRQDDPFSAILDIEEFPGCVPCAPKYDLRILPSLGFHHLSEQRWDHVRILEIEIIPWAIEINGNEDNGIEAILASIRIRLNELVLLRYTIWSPRDNRSRCPLP
jgi:hypothetical protein